MEWTCTTRVYAQACPNEPGMFCLVPEHVITIVAFGKALHSRFHFCKYRTLADAQADARTVASETPNAYFMIDHDWHEREAAVHG